MDEAQRLNAHAATIYAALYWLGVIVAAAQSGNHIAVVVALAGVVLGFASHALAYAQPNNIVAHLLSLGCNLVAVIAAAALLLGYLA